MADASSSGTRPLSPWWSLLILPVFLCLGWFIGQVQAPKPPAPAAAWPGGPAGPGNAQYSDWTTLDRALAESQRNGKPVLLDFNAEWCGPCQAMKHQVFEDPTRGDVVHTSVIPVSITDRRREDGSNPPEVEALQQRYDLSVFPTLVVFSPQTGRMKKAEGFGDPDATLKWITRAARSVR